MVKVGDRVMARRSEDAPTAVPATVVARVSHLFVDIEYDEPQQRENYAGVPYLTSYSCTHVALLDAIDETRLW